MGWTVVPDPSVVTRWIIRRICDGSSVMPGGTTVLSGGTSVLPGGKSVLPGGTSVLPGGTSVLPGVTSVLPGGTPVLHGGTRKTNFHFMYSLRTVKFLCIVFVFVTMWDTRKTRTSWVIRKNSWVVSCTR